MPKLRSSRSGPGPRRAADAYVRDLVVGGRDAAAKHFSPYAMPVLKSLPTPVAGQDPDQVVASGVDASDSTICLITQIAPGAKREPCFYYTLKTENEKAPPYDSRST